MELGPLLDVILLGVCLVAGLLAYIIGRRVGGWGSLGGRNPQTTARGHILSFALWTISITALVGIVLTNANTIYAFLGGSGFLRGSEDTGAGEFGGESFVGVMAIVFGFPVALAGAVYAIYLAQASLETSARQALFDDPDYQAKRAAMVEVSRLKMLREMLSALPRSQSSLPMLLRALRENLRDAARTPLSKEVIGAICIVGTDRDLSKYIAYSSELEGVVEELADEIEEGVTVSAPSLKGKIRVVESHLLRVIAELEQILEAGSSQLTSKDDVVKSRFLLAQQPERAPEAVATLIREKIGSMIAKGTNVGALRLVVGRGESTYECEQLLVNAFDSLAPLDVDGKIFNAGTSLFRSGRENLIADHLLENIGRRICLVYSPPGNVDRNGEVQLKQSAEAYLAAGVAREAARAIAESRFSEAIQSDAGSNVSVTLEKAMMFMSGYAISAKLISSGRHELPETAIRILLSKPIEEATSLASRTLGDENVSKRIEEGLKGVLPRALIISLQMPTRGAQDVLGIADPVAEQEDEVIHLSSPSDLDFSDAIEVRPSAGV
ncbi:MAG: hypothetical protein U1D69_01650 [Polynucleobacter sp.]|nr:hypothetical protein [Polynucleobacter sp.]